MDICGFFDASSSKLTLIASSSESEDSEAEYLEPSPPKKQCVSSTVPAWKALYQVTSTFKLT